MTVFAPGAIDAYFRAIAEDDTDALLACFTDDAVVSDEGTIHRGTEEIRAWRERTKSVYRYTADVLRTEGQGGRYVVTARLTGDFPGSPVEMPYHFTLRDGLISSSRSTPKPIIAAA